MRVFITGINGFVGAQLARRFRAAGHQVAGTARDPQRLPRDVRDVDAVPWSLDQAMPKGALDSQDVVVHCAYAADKQQFADNAPGTRTAREAALEANVPRQIFVSSFSAIPSATSAYGQMKFELEQDFAGEGMSIVRPGLVAGPGGLFARMAATVGKLPVLPLPAGGRRAVPLIGHDDLADCVLAIATSEQPRPATNLCYAERPPLRSVLQAIARTLGKRRLWMTIPIGMVLPPVQLLHLIGLRFGVSPESLKAYRTNSEDHHVSDYPSFGLPERPLDEIVARALSST